MFKFNLFYLLSRRLEEEHKGVSTLWIYHNHAERGSSDQFEEFEGKMFRDRKRALFSSVFR
jgi:hypothetical protein